MWVNYPHSRFYKMRCIISAFEMATKGQAGFFFHGNSERPQTFPFETGRRSLEDNVSCHVIVNLQTG
jgi:hypothetical protein